MSAVSRLNTFLNNSSDLRTMNPDKRSSVDTSALWNDILQQNDEAINNQRNSGDGSLPLSRLLAQTYSYSSDSSSSPLATNTSRLSPPQISSRGSGVFSYSDDSPQSNGSTSSRQSFNYSSNSLPYPSRGLSDPGSPTLDDALLMGGLPDSPFSQNGSNCSKVKDLNLSELMSSLSVTNNGSSLCGGSPLLSSINGGHVGRHLPSSSSTHSPLNGNPLLSQLSSNSGSTMLANSLGLNNGGNFGLGSNCSSPPNLSPGLNSSHSLSQGMDLNSLAQLQNMWLSSRVLPNLLDSPNLFGGMGDLRNSPNSPPLSPLPSIFPGSDPYAIEKAAKMHRNAAALCDATCTWSGALPSRVTKNPFYSCKVFLGGVPWDVTELALRQAFLQFGSIQVEWPGKENSANPPKGYVYVLFENEKQVKALLAACTQDFNSENYYFKISSRRMRQKEVQVIPWVISESNYVRCPSYQLDPAKTVFVGALHGMLSAEGLANIMNDLFGGVVYSGIDTDKHKYPIGSGRVTFNNVLSYRKAVRAAFIEIKTPKFTKKVQVDPYLADSPCQLCGSQQGPYFCRDENCFKYYCRSCWQITHSGDVNSHKPLMRDPKLRSQTTINRLL